MGQGRGDTGRMVEMMSVREVGSGSCWGGGSSVRWVSPQVGLGSVVFAVGLMVWASGQLIHEESVVVAWVLYLVGGAAAVEGFRRLLGVRWKRGRWWAHLQPAWLYWPLAVMMTLVGVSRSYDGAAGILVVSAGVVALVVGFAFAVAELRVAQERFADTVIVEERQRVAADVHDIVGHAMAVTMLHINAARLSLPANPGAAIEALEDAARNGRASMHEIRGIVRLLRDDDGPTLHSQPDLGDLVALLGSFSDSGVKIRSDAGIDIDVGSGGLSQLASVTAYRLVQEGLTNAVRHGDGPIDIRVSAADGAVELVVVNHIRRSSGNADQGIGVGLAGARARVTAVGGTFEAGPAEDAHCWLFKARIPA